MFFSKQQLSFFVLLSKSTPTNLELAKKETIVNLIF
jgi:hypothetical protein